MNEETSSLDSSGSLPEIRGALYKGYSLVAGWFLRLHTRTSYWDIYDAVTKNKNCQVRKIEKPIRIGTINVIILAHFASSSKSK